MTDARHAVALENCVESVRAAKKYAAVEEGFVRSLARRALASGHEGRDAVKAVRNRLHQVAGAFLAGRPRWDAWRAEVETCADAGELRACCRRLFARHASTRERLPYLESFYPSVFAGLPPVRRLLDLACGLHPLALPWMDLPPDAEVLCCDVLEDLVAFLGDFLPLLPLRAGAEARDVLSGLPAGPFDAAFLLKILPSLERIERGAARRVLEAVPADHVVVSFPARSLGGRDKGMCGRYGAWFGELADGVLTSVRQIEFPAETVFIGRKA